MDAALSTAQWVVGKAVAAAVDGLLEKWGASKNLGLNIEALKMELLLVQVTLESASGKKIDGPAMKKLLQKLRDSAHSADDLLDELDYFRIHDQLHDTYDTADQHGKGGIHDFILNARHTAKAVGKLACLSSCWSGANPVDPRQQVPLARQRLRGNSSLATPNANQDDEKVSRYMPKLGKLLPCSSSPHVHGDDGVPVLKFNRVDLSERMKHIIEELQPTRREAETILQSCGPSTVPNIVRSRSITTDQSIESKLYGRDDIVNSIIHDMTKGKYHSKHLTVLPIVGPGGIGKTTMIQHIYHKQEVQNHFQVTIWVCVSLSFDLNKLLKEITKYIPKVEGEKGNRPDELIKQRLTSKRFLLVLDDIWEFSNEDDWKRFLLPLQTSQEKGSVILVTTRFEATAQIVQTTKSSIELEGLKPKEYRELFLSYTFCDEPFRSDHERLLETGDKIMEKLKGSPLAAKTVGRLLRDELNLHHWRKVLESKQWERQSNANDIMPALKLSYDYLPFQQQQCFCYSALFPEDYKYSRSQLINLWIGLDILKYDGHNKRLEDIGSSNLKNLVTHGFFREEHTNGRLSYVMHDLLHDLALKVASHEFITLSRSNVGSVEIHRSIRHLSIIIDDVADDNAESVAKFKSQLRELKTKFQVEHLQTLMLFGELDKSFANIFYDLFREAYAIRVLHLPQMPCHMESMLHNFSSLVHLRYLCLGTNYSCQMHLPLDISKFYHLRILDLGFWYGGCDFPKDMSNLAKLCHFYTPSNELHSDISNVGKLKLLEELKVFRVNKENEGFELKQLVHLTELRELGIYNLENIHTKEEALEAKLIEKEYLKRLTLDWDGKRSNIDPNVEEVVLESLQPHRNLQELCIKGHQGPSCPTWLGNKLAVDALQSLQLVGVSWEVFPCLGMMCDLREVKLEHISTMKEFVVEKSFFRLTTLTLIGLENFEKWVPSQDVHHMFPVLQVLIIRDCPKLSVLPFSNHIVCPPNQERNKDWFPKLQELEVRNCPKFLLVAPIPWTETLRQVNMRGVKLLESFEYSKSSSGVHLSINGNDDLHSINQVLAPNILAEVIHLTLEKGLRMELRHLLRLTSLEDLTVKKCPPQVLARKSGSLVGPAEVQGDVKWDLPVVQFLRVHGCCASGKELAELITHLPRLSDLTISSCENITHLAVGVDLQTLATSETAVSERDDGGLLLLPSQLSDSLRMLNISECPELVLVDPPTLLPGVGGLQGLRFLEKLVIRNSPKFLSTCLVSSPSRFLFPSSLQSLEFWDVEGMGTLELLSNLTSLTSLDLRKCGEDLRCEGLGCLSLRKLIVFSSPRFFDGWIPNARRMLQHEGGGEEHRRQIVSPLQELYTDDAVGLLAVPICSFLSSSLSKLHLYATEDSHLECLSKEQEDALQLLTSLQELMFTDFEKLQNLPAGLHKLPNLKILYVSGCPALWALPQDGLPISLQHLDVSSCGNEELTQQCRGLVRTRPEIYLED